MARSRRAPAKAEVATGISGTFEVHSEKKHSVRFGPADEQAEQMLSSIYVNNEALAALGYEQGGEIRISIELI